MVKVFGMKKTGSTDDDTESKSDDLELVLLVEVVEVVVEEEVLQSIVRTPSPPSWTAAVALSLSSSPSFKGCMRWKRDTTML
jgi:hypothetical protein